MKVHYCDTPAEKTLPCQVAWGRITCNGATACWDKPIEDNCRNLVEAPEPKTEVVK